MWWICQTSSTQKQSSETTWQKTYFLGLWLDFINPTSIITQGTSKLSINPTKHHFLIPLATYTHPHKSFKLTEIDFWCENPITPGDVIMLICGIIQLKAGSVHLSVLSFIILPWVLFRGKLYRVFVWPCRYDVIEVYHKHFLLNLNLHLKWNMLPQMWSFSEVLPSPSPTTTASKRCNNCGVGFDLFG